LVIHAALEQQKRPTRVQEDALDFQHAPRPDSKAANSSSVDSENLKADIDDVLEELDRILGENEEFQNAQEFLNAFVQAGGE